MSDRREPTTDELFAHLTRRLTQASEDYERGLKRINSGIQTGAQANLMRDAITAQFRCLHEITLLLVKVERQARRGW